MAKHIKTTPRAATGALALALAGCAATGDPRQGGLFGWSEDLARQRQEALRQQDSAAQEQARAQDRRGDELRGQQARLAVDSQRLQGELQRLLAENAALESQLRGLMRQRRLNDEQTRHLQGLLAANARLRGDVATPPAAGKPQPAPAQADAVNAQNGRLHREVMILLQQ